MNLPFDQDDAAHLLRRAGFGPSHGEIDKAVAKGLDKTLAALFKPDKTKDDDFTVDPGVPIEDVPVHTLQAWWLRRMIASKRPLTEKMTLFWHNHFATSFHKVTNVLYLHQQNRQLRKHALGRFRDLLTAIAQNPAMIYWLDNQQNVKGKPNENFARELMELFTTGAVDQAGDPNYTETDVKESARAFTGWHIANDAFFFDAAAHDFGVKTFRGLTGNLDGTDVIEQLVLDPATARRLAWKLFSFFAREVALDDPILDPLVTIYFDHDTAIEPMVEAIFRMPEFYSTQTRYAHVKSPIEFLVGSMRLLGGHVSLGGAHEAELGKLIEELGQSIFDPPSVFGWKEGPAWVTSNRMLQRMHAAEQLADGRKADDGAFWWKPQTLLGKPAKWSKYAAAEVVERCLDRLGPVPAADSTRTILAGYLAVDDDQSPVPFSLDDATADKKVRGLIALILSSPEFQLA